MPFYVALNTQNHMRKLFFFLAFFISLHLYSQKTTLTIPSSKLQEDREVTILLPASYDKDSKKNYPLLVLLDGEYLLDPFQGALNFGTYWDEIPEVIIVAINQNKNAQRYSDTEVNPANGLPIEKGSEFFEFIAQEVLPSLEKEYRISPLKIIAGHDVTAGFINFFLYKEKPLFNAFISLSPELSNGMEIQIPERLKAIPEPIFYYVSTGNGDLKKMQKRIIALDTAVKSIAKPTLNYKFDNFTTASHNSLVLFSIPEALYQLFAIYQPISSNEYSEKIAILPSGYVTYLKNKYDSIEKTLYLKMPIRYNDFKAIEVAILKNKAYAELEQLADLANKIYPKSMLSDYEIGMMYEKMEDYQKAIRFYQKSYSKEEIGDLTKDFLLDKIQELKK